MRIRALSIVVGGIALAACTTEGGGDDGGILDVGGPVPCAVDRFNTRETAKPITLGQPYLGEAAICPATDRDFYTFTLPGPSLVQIDVGYPAGATSRVELAYEVIRLDGAGMEFVAASAQDTVASDNRSALSRRHYLDTGGQYWLRVRDVADDESDVRNFYGVTVSAASDPDPNEPNDTCMIGTPITGTGRGAITFAGDRDAHTVTIPAGVQIVDATITTTAASAVDLKVSLFDADGRFLTSSTDARGEDGATNLRVRFGMESRGGTYCFVVEDDDGADSDPLTSYAITYQLVAEPDANETTARNDTPDDAVDIGMGGMRQGIIASTADLDWYRVDVPARRIAEITVTCPGCTIQPSISIVYGDPDTPCDGSSPCDYLLRPDGDCQVDSDCRMSGVCRAVPGGAKRCARACGDRFDCNSFQCQQNGPVSACVGAASCATGLCGVLQYTAVADMTGTIRTAQPLIRTRTWILVRDFQDDQFSATPYTLSVNVVNDPDTREPNNFYFPYTDAEAGDILNRGRNSATRVAWSAAMPGMPRTASGSGCIGYQGDIDIFRIEGGNPCGTGNCGLSVQYDRPGGDIDLAYFLHNEGLGIRSSFLASREGVETVFGDAMCTGMGGEQECMTYRQDDSGDYYLVVRSFGQDAWDVSPARCYNWTLRAAPAAGCPGSCPMVMNGNCVCQ